MNYTTAIFLVNDLVRAVAVSYETDAEGKGIKPFTTFKTMDPDLKPGTMVLIPTDTRHKMTVARIEEVDLEVDQDSPVQMKWIIGPVDDTAYRAILTQEEAGIARIKSAELAAKRRQLAEKLLADNPDIKALAGVAAGAAPALEAPGQPPEADPF